MNVFILVGTAAVTLGAVLLFRDRATMKTTIPNANVTIDTDDASGAVREIVIAPRVPPVNTNAPRGIKNNNPGNLVYIATNPYFGQIGRDGAYGVYDTPEHGIRAMTLNLWSYFHARNLRTVESIITVWAPPVENDTTSYIRAVSQRLNVSPGTTLAWNRATIFRLVRAIIRHENGVDPYTDAQINGAMTDTGKFND